MDFKEHDRVHVKHIDMIQCYNRQRLAEVVSDNPNTVFTVKTTCSYPIRYGGASYPCIVIHPESNSECTFHVPDASIAHVSPYTADQWSID